MCQQMPPLLVQASSGDEPLGYVYHLSPDFAVADLRSALESQLTLNSFQFVCFDGLTPLHRNQEHCLRIRDVWGESGCVRIKWTGSRAKFNGCFACIAKNAHIPGQCLVLPIAAAAAAAALSFAIGILCLSVTQVAHIALEGSRGGAMASKAAGGGEEPADDYQYYLFTFRKVWESTLSALVTMITAYLNGPATILCHLGEVVTNCLQAILIKYFEVFKQCWEVIVGGLLKILDDYVAGPTVSLCHSLDNVILTVKECVIKYLEVFAACFDHAVEPQNAMLLIGIAVVSFVGTAFVVHVALHDAGAFCPWPCPRRRRPKPEELPMMMP